MPTEPNRIVVNTGPLIALGRIDAFGIVAQLPLHFFVPKEVALEIEAGTRMGYPVALPSWAKVISVKNAIVPLAPQLLDAGEAAVIQLAIENSIEYVCIDEWRGRRAAATVGLKVTGSLGLLGRAKRLGLIKSLRPWVDKLTATGIYYHPNLIQTFLDKMGE